MTILLKRNKKLKERARDFRKNMNTAEKKLWYEVLSKDQLLRLRFLRQRVIDNYIADFYCAKLKLVIEVDGSSHLERVEYDRERSLVFKKLGIVVLRIKNDLVLNNIEKAREEIEWNCLQILPSLSKGDVAKRQGD
ncbi:MAG: hypothetical protein A2Y40_07315 [Candidatus Margulisbacteria bacterium GWF2_35_9]|nr:MAG: hypothetical protein A2Y40_07315 [Candidatus Margulisbacteria bacterium GWF2_35_9]